MPDSILRRKTADLAPFLRAYSGAFPNYPSSEPELPVVIFAKRNPLSCRWTQ